MIYEILLKKFIEKWFRNENGLKFLVVIEVLCIFIL